MLQSSPVLLNRGGAYYNRVPYFSYRRKNAAYLAPKTPHVKTPLANKSPEEYHQIWDHRTGIDWYNRIRKRHEYRHWPWVTWNDDPVRQHGDEVCRRTFSALNAASSEKPLWNLYERVGQDYRLPNNAPVKLLAPYIALYTARVWSKERVASYLLKLQEKWSTIEDVHANLPAVVEWNVRANVMPPGLMTHVEYIVNDVVLLNRKKAFRIEEHEKGFLRTNSMERYYALPYMKTGPAMPKKLVQVPGVYPRGGFTEMVGVKYLEGYVIDSEHGRAMYPA